MAAKINKLNKSKSVMRLPIILLAVPLLLFVIIGIFLMGAVIFFWVAFAVVIGGRLRKVGFESQIGDIFCVLFFGLVREELGGRRVGFDKQFFQVGFAVGNNETAVMAFRSIFLMFLVAFGLIDRVDRGHAFVGLLVFILLLVAFLPRVRLDLGVGHVAWDGVLLLLWHLGFLSFLVDFVFVLYQQASQR
jgi:hypothetical protein